MPKSNQSKITILNILAKHPRGISGYDIKKTLAAMSVCAVAQSNSQIYPVLERLQEEKMVTHEIDESSGKRNRCAWKITPSGLTDLKRWLKKPAKLKHGLESIVMKISGGAQQPKQQLIEHLQDYLKQIEVAQDESDVVLENAEQDYANSPSLPFVRINNTYGKEMLAARKKWAKDAIKAIEKIK